jgi:hypothetical protein
MQHLQDRRTAACIVAVALAITWSALTRAAAPSSATLSPTSGSVAWDGFSSVAATSPDGDNTCVEATNCDTFTLTLAPGDYTGKRVRVKASWTNQLNDYDVYIHQGGLNGPVLSPPNGGPPSTAEESTFDVNGAVTAGVNDVYTIHVVYYASIRITARPRSKRSRRLPAARGLRTSSPARRPASHSAAAARSTRSARDRMSSRTFASTIRETHTSAASGDCSAATICGASI